MSYRTGSISSITVGSSVSWRAGGQIRTGRVVKAVHAGRGSAAAAGQFIRAEVAAGRATSTAKTTTDRRETSFVVMVREPGTDKVILFWPRTGALCTAAAAAAPIAA